MTPQHNDPLWRMRHALVGLLVALLLSVLLASWLGATVADRFVGATYNDRLIVYAVLLVHVVAGAVVLFIRVARHETRPLTLPRLGLWLLSLWLWPLLCFNTTKPTAPAEPK